MQDTIHPVERGRDDVVSDPASTGSTAAGDRTSIRDEVWRSREREATDDIEAGRVATFEDVEELIADLDR